MMILQQPILGTILGAVLAISVFFLLELLLVIYLVKKTPYPLLLEHMYRERWKHIWWFIKCLFGFGNVENGSLCWFSKKFWNLHDYPEKKGGDGSIWHMAINDCHKCGMGYNV